MTNVVLHKTLGKFHKLPRFTDRLFFKNSNPAHQQPIHIAHSDSTIFEIVCGVGGSEAMLFADEMAGMYVKYFQRKGWTYQVLERDTSSYGGVRRSSLQLTGGDTFEGMISEAGVHRVQRVPKTDKQNRIHTSTISISVIPKSVMDIKINEKDLEMQTMRSSGPGGQKVNKAETLVRFKHRPSGLVAESQETRHQIQNRDIALSKLLEMLRSRELEKLTSKSEALKKSQIGNADRNEKVRTYNFPQDRITDHRLQKSYSNLRALFEGDTAILDRLINDFHGR